MYGAVPKYPKMRAERTKNVAKKTSGGEKRHFADKT
jgi:hypothetical protein